MQKKILIVDDEPCVLEMLRMKLEAGGFSVFEAADGLSAVSEAENIRPDLIVLDLMIPGIDGFRVCNTLKKDPKFTAIPIIILTARVNEQDKQRCFNCGADAYMAKPLDLDALMNRINQFIK